MKKKIRVLIVEDSFLMQRMIEEIISSDPGLEVVDKAKNGEEAIEKISRLRPDVVTLDINIPHPDGFSVLKEVMKRSPTRIVVLSGHTPQGGPGMMQALALGAIDFIPKPSGEISLDIDKLKEQIISKIKIAAEVDLKKFLFNLRLTRFDTLKPQTEITASVELKKLVIIGASTGGPSAILQIMRNIPPTLPAAFLIVQHMPEGFTLSFAERISLESKIKAKEAQQGDIVSAGKAYVAAAGYHMELEKTAHNINNGLSIKLTQGPPVNFVRPSVSVTLESAALAFCPNVIGVILTGIGKDGLDGAREVKKRGGVMIAQDQATSIIFGMPKVVIDEGLIDNVVPIDKIARKIIQNVNGSKRNG